MSIALTANTLAQELALMIRTQIPTFLWGPPGVGKSQLTRQVADALKHNLIDLRLSQLDPVDLRGIPHVNGDGRTHWAQPDMLPREDRDGPQGVLFLDELNAAPPAMAAAAYQLVLDRKLGDYDLPDGWVVIAAGNRETDRGVTSTMPTPLANRFAHFEFEVSVKDWTTWATRTGLPGELPGFIRYRPELLLDFEPKRKEKAFPSPRSWEAVGKLVIAGGATVNSYGALVGRGAASEFAAFCKLWKKLPDIAHILAKPDSASVPNDPGLLFAVSAAIAMHATADNFERVARYAARLPNEYTVFAMTDAVNRDETLTKTQPWQQFTVEFQDVLM